MKPTIEGSSTTQNATVFNQAVYSVASLGTFCFFGIVWLLEADEYRRFDADEPDEIYFWVIGSFAIAGTLAFITYYFLRNKLILYGRIGLIFASALTLVIHHFKYGIEELQEDYTDTDDKQWISGAMMESVAWLLISTIDFILANNSRISETLGLMKIAGFWIIIGITRILVGEDFLNLFVDDYGCKHSYESMGYLHIFTGVFFIIAGLIFLIVTWTKCTPKAYFGAIFSTFMGVLLFTIAFNCDWHCENERYSGYDWDTHELIEDINRRRVLNFMQSCALLCAAFLYFPTLKTVQSGIEMTAS